MMALIAFILLTALLITPNLMIKPLNFDHCNVRRKIKPNYANRKSPLIPLMIVFAHSGVLGVGIKYLFIKSDIALLV